MPAVPSSWGHAIERMLEFISYEGTPCQSKVRARNLLGSGANRQHAHNSPSRKCVFSRVGLV